MAEIQAASSPRSGKPRATNPAAPRPTLYTTDLSAAGLRQVLLRRQQ